MHLNKEGLVIIMEKGIELATRGNALFKKLKKPNKTQLAAYLSVQLSWFRCLNERAENLFKTGKITCSCPEGFDEKSLVLLKDVLVEGGNEEANDKLAELVRELTTSMLKTLKGRMKMPSREEMEQMVDSINDEDGPKDNPLIEF